MLALLALLACTQAKGAEIVELRMWAFGREGEVVQQLVRDFERENPGIRVRLQGIPWTAAHEKLLTAFVGDATPDVAQLGNTWIPEFAALGALAPLDSFVARSAAIDRGDYFPGIWATNILGDTLFGVPWYVDTRVMFYRRDMLARAGTEAPPRTWAEWRDAMRRVKALGGNTRFAMLMPLDEWAQPVILALQNGSPLLKDGGRYGAFQEPAFRQAFEFYVGLFREGLAPAVANTQVSNLYQEIAQGTFAMYISGPWNLGEFKTRIPPELQNAWSTMPLPGPTPEQGLSIAGGSSLVLFAGSAHQTEAWKLVEFLERPAQQLRFYRLTGDLPARESAWQDSTLADPRAQAFLTQLRRVEPLPKVPEWELIATRIAQAAEQAARGRLTIDEALRALDRDVNEILEKRRWMLDKNRGLRIARHGHMAARNAQFAILPWGR